MLVFAGNRIQILALWLVETFRIITCTITWMARNGSGSGVTF